MFCPQRLDPPNSHHLTYRLEQIRQNIHPIENQDFYLPIGKGLSITQIFVNLLSEKLLFTKPGHTIAALSPLSFHILLSSFFLEIDFGSKCVPSDVQKKATSSVAEVLYALSYTGSSSVGERIKGKRSLIGPQRFWSRKRSLPKTYYFKFFKSCERSR